MTGGLPCGQGVIMDVDDDVYNLIIGEQGEDEACNDVVRRCWACHPPASEQARPGRGHPVPAASLPPGHPPTAQGGITCPR
jgi:hypothetical protein